VAAELRRDPQNDVELIDGEHGEFSVSVDGREVARKNGGMPSDQEVMAAVGSNTPAAAGT